MSTPSSTPAAGGQGEKTDTTTTGTKTGTETATKTGTETGTKTTSDSASKSTRELRAGDDVYVRRKTARGQSTLNLDAAKSAYGGMAGVQSNAGASAPKSKRDVEAVVKARKEALLRDLRPKHAIIAQSVDRAKEAVINKYRSRHPILMQRPGLEPIKKNKAVFWKRFWNNKTQDGGGRPMGESSGSDEALVTVVKSNGEVTRQKAGQKKDNKRKTKEERERDLEARKMALLNPHKFEAVPLEEATCKDMDMQEVKPDDMSEPLRSESELSEIERDTAPLLTLEEAAQLINQPSAVSILTETAPTYNPYEDLDEILRRQKYYFNTEHLKVNTASNMGTLIPAGPTLYKNTAFQERTRSDILFNPEVSVRRYNPHNKQEKPKEAIEPIIDKAESTPDCSM